jgi:ribosomal protein S12 methylthiotransferase accessory factor
MDLIVTFPGNKKVNAEYKGFTIETDQPEHSGGDGAAPAPFDLFLASIGTCAGIYVVGFCQNRGISLEGSRIVQSMERDPEKKLITKITITVELPPGFPEKYTKALMRAVDQCTVKRHMVDAPEFELKAVPAG